MRDSWGELMYGKCGFQGDIYQLTPRHVPLPEVVRWVSCGEQHTLVATGSGKMFAFGLGSDVRLPFRDRGEQG